MLLVGCEPTKKIRSPTATGLTGLVPYLVDAVTATVLGPNTSPLVTSNC